MHLSHRAIETPRLVLLAAILACFIGSLAVIDLPKERTPRVKLPVIVVAVPNFGAAPDTNEREIVRRVEDEVGQLSGKLRSGGAVRSEAVSGAAVLQFVFDDHVEVANAKDEVESLINRVKGEFPTDAQQDPGPLVNDIAFDQWPVIQVFIAGGQDGQHRHQVAGRLKLRLETVDGVAGVDIFGGLEREVQVQINPHVLTLYGFDYETVAQAIRRANMDAPTGEVESDTGRVSRARTRGKLESLAQIAAVPIGVRDGRTILLDDAATVSMGHVPRTSIARYDSQDAVVLLARPKTDIDVLATANRIQQIVDSFDAAGTNIGTARSQAREIGYMLDQLLTSAFFGTILVIILLWIAMGWRNAMIISIALPFAILTAATLMWVSKKSINPEIAVNNMTLFAVILVVGMVVDGGIIVGENIYRHRELGRSPVESSKRGITEVSGALICAYLTTFAAFAPMFLVRGVMGDFMELLPIVVMYALLAAMLVDHFLLPVISVYIMKVPQRKLAAARKALHQRRQADIEAIADAESAAQGRITQTYGKMLHYALHHRLLVLALAVIMVLTPVGLFKSGAIGFVFFPSSDIPIIELYFELPLGSSMEQRTAEVAHTLEKTVLRTVHQDEWYRPSPTAPPARPVTTIGQPGALNIRLDTEAGTGPEFGMIYIELEDAGNRRRSADQIRAAIVEALPDIPGVKVRVKSPTEGPPTGAPVLVRVLAHTDTPMEQLIAKAEQIEKLLESMPGTYDVTNDYRRRPEITVNPNRATASLFGVDSAQIATSINYALEGVRVDNVDFGGDDEIDIRVRNALAHRDQLLDLSNLPLRSAGGKVVSLDQVADVTPTRNANVIRHYDQRRVIQVRSQLKTGLLADDIKGRLTRALHTSVVETPPPLEGFAARVGRWLGIGGERSTAEGSTLEERVIWADDQVVVEFGGENQIRDEAMDDLNLALMVAAAAILIILVIKFNSFVQPLIVLFSVPLSLVGVTIGLMICGFNFSISAMIGVVALAGIVVNDAIVLVDFINKLRAVGVPPERAVVYASQLRLRPIFMTTVTTIGGLLPLGLNLAGGGEFWQPLTVTIMFGLGFATLLQLFVIPLACYSFDRRSRPGLLDPMQRPDLSSEVD